MYKWAIEDFEEDFKLIAIHCSLEAYQLSFLLNQKLTSKLKRDKDHKIFDEEACYELFNWHDPRARSDWRLVRNKCLASVDASHAGTLFKMNKAVNHLVTEHISVDFFLKIENEVKGVRNIVSEINQIPQVITAYQLHNDQLRSKTNLIFD